MSKSAMISVTAVTNLHPPDPIRRDHQYNRRHYHQARYRDPCGCRIGNNCKRTFLHWQGHERVEVVNHTDLFQQRWQEEVQPLPSIQQQRGNDRIANKQTYNQKESTVAYACQNGYSGICEKLYRPRTFKKVTSALGT